MKDMTNDNTTLMQEMNRTIGQLASHFVDMRHGLTRMNDRLTRMEVLQEETDSNVKAILEVLTDHGRQLTELSSLARDIPEMKADIKTIKAALSATNHQVADHEHRISRLESKAA